MPPLVPPRERLAWLAALLLIAGLLVITRFKSVDADSVRYATISATLSTLPVGRWVAPEWWGLSPDNPLSGYFLEHPAGLFLIPAATARLGVPADQAPYIFGVAVGLASLLLASYLLARLTSRQAGRAALVLLQFMPLAFVFRIRDNHEYPMLVCLLVSLIGLARIGDSPVWGAAVAFGFVAALLVKGVFAAIVLLAAALWIVVNPTHTSRARQVVACLVALALMGLTAFLYDVWYAHVTGGPFWAAYWARQIQPVEVASPIGEARTFTGHLAFYLGRLLFHPAPWSIALAWTIWRGRRGWRAARDSPAVRGLAFVLAFTAASVLLLSLASRFAERYAFSASYLVGAAGVAALGDSWPSVARWVARLDERLPMLPVIVWIGLAALRLALGPWLPRIGG
jgi:4-amino-4-deoxy-L-arabinose transferase-like glycosyltransferase